jgi:quercetin dioxygenase-like cupin family protein
MIVDGEHTTVAPGMFVVHPPGEIHEYVNGNERTLLFRVRYGDDMESRHFDKNQAFT